MRSLVVLAGVLPVLAGCGGSGTSADENMAVDYRPPTVTSRLDFGGMVERRFHRLDVNADDRLTPDELPPRLRGIMAQADTDGDGSLNSQEWGAFMLGRFDQLDLNKDGSVTSEERATAMERIAPPGGISVLGNSTDNAVVPVPDAGADNVSGN